MTQLTPSRIRGLFDVIRKPAHLKIILRDALKLTEKLHADAEHLRAAMEWLCRAQEIGGGNGVAGWYSFVAQHADLPDGVTRGPHRGWLPPYPETTGYIIPTFLNYGAFSGDDGYVERAIRMGDWEIDIQMADGAIRGSVGEKGTPRVFNTGQVMIGWLALHRVTGARRYIDAAVRAADWLVGAQDADGKWIRHTYKGIPRVYHTRVAWPLLEAYAATGREEYRRTAERFIAWALTQAHSNGWFDGMAFTADENPWTHTIAYTLRGLLESAAYLGNGLINVVEKAGEHLLLRYERRKFDPYGMPDYLPGAFHSNWKPVANYSCLTGNSQIAMIWLKLYALNGDARYLNGALKLIDQVKATQLLTSRHPGIRGGIAGSYPIWGRYAIFAYPNWAAKFFADALMLQETTLHALEGAAR